MAQESTERVSVQQRVLTRSVSSIAEERHVNDTRRTMSCPNVNTTLWMSNAPRPLNEHIRRNLENDRLLHMTENGWQLWYDEAEFLKSVLNGSTPRENMSSSFKRALRSMEEVAQMSQGRRPFLDVVNRPSFNASGREDWEGESIYEVDNSTTGSKSSRRSSMSPTAKADGPLELVPWCCSEGTSSSALPTMTSFVKRKDVGFSEEKASRATVCDKLEGEKEFCETDSPFDDDLVGFSPQMYSSGDEDPMEPILSENISLSTQMSIKKIERGGRNCFPSQSKHCGLGNCFSRLQTRKAPKRAKKRLGKLSSLLCGLVPSE